jgi:hypothetical protein
VRLDVREQLDLATWASKTVLAFEFHEPTTVVSKQEDRELVRTELRPPHHHLARIAYRDTYHESFVGKVLVARTDRAEDDRPNAFSALLGIGHLIIQVWGGHGADTDGLAVVGTRSNRSIMIWPPVMTAVDWPPQSTPEESFDELAREVIPWADDSPGLAEWRDMRRDLE